MDDINEYEDFKYITNEEFLKLKESALKICLVELLVFNKPNQQEFFTTNYLIIKHTDKNNINKCLEIVHGEYSSEKSFTDIKYILNSNLEIRY